MESVKKTSKKKFQVSVPRESNTSRFAHNGSDSLSLFSFFFDNSDSLNLYQEELIILDSNILN